MLELLWDSIFSPCEVSVFPSLMAVIRSLVYSSSANSSCLTILEISKEESLKDELFLFLFSSTFIRAKFLGKINIPRSRSSISEDYSGHLIRYFDSESY